MPYVYIYIYMYIYIYIYILCGYMYMLWFSGEIDTQCAVLQRRALPDRTSKCWKGPK